MKNNYKFSCSYKENGIVKSDGVITIFDATSKEEARKRAANATNEKGQKKIIESSLKYLGMCK